MSWLLLDHEDPAHRSPEEGLVDCGWVEQMRPFLREFSRPDQVVLDPFAGWGTTLVAAVLEGRRALGLEIEPARAEAARRRLALYGSPSTVEVRCADTLREPLPPVDLVLTNLPYFQGAFAGEPGQLYAIQAYEDYLTLLERVFSRLTEALQPGGHLIVMAQNLRRRGQFLPLAWDVGRLLGRLLELQDERILCYPPTPQRRQRLHEYVLIGRRAHG